MKFMKLFKLLFGLLFLGNVVFAKTQSADINSELPKEIPAWVDAEIENASKRIDEWGKGRNYSLFIFVTDLHTAMDLGRLDKRLQIRYANRAAEKLGANAILNLGDWGFEYPIKKEHDGFAFFDSILALHSETKIPTFFCRGNHDWWYGFISHELWGWRIPRVNGAVYSKIGDYGYCDYPDKKCRMFFLNSSETGPMGYGFSKTQMEFFENNLKNMSKDWTAVVFEHRCFDKLGSWVNGTVRKIRNEKLFLKTMSDFVKNGGKLAGNIVGDSHFDNFGRVDGINIFVSQGCGGIAKENVPEDVVYIKADWKKEMLVEAVLIDSDNREIKFVRIGVGGEKKDRIAKF